MRKFYSDLENGPRTAILTPFCFGEDPQHLTDEQIEALESLKFELVPLPGLDPFQEICYQISCGILGAETLEEILEGGEALRLLWVWQEDLDLPDLRPYCSGMVQILPLASLWIRRGVASALKVFGPF